jgi:3-hydroxyacyl-CoA dehydrogenase
MSTSPTKIAIIGAGTIGLSFAALHLTKDPTCLVTIYDNRPDLQSYVAQHLPGYLIDVSDHLSCTSRLSFAKDLKEAVRDADIVQEQGPENTAFKVKIWPEIERYAKADALFWSSTSGIPASEQARDMRDKTRLVVCHPYNPPQ